MTDSEGYRSQRHLLRHTLTKKNFARLARLYKYSTAAIIMTDGELMPVEPRTQVSEMPAKLNALLTCLLRENNLQFVIMHDFVF